jgi:hypothetical protein
MTTYDEYEGMIVALLAQPNVDAQPLPLIERLNDPRDVTKPRVYVLFTGSTFEDTPHLGNYSQYEPLTFGLSIQALTRDGENGIFAVAEESMQRLLRWRPPDSCSRVSLTSFKIVDPSSQNKWQYQLDFTFTRVRVKRKEEEEEFNYGTIKKIENKIETTI